MHLFAYGSLMYDPVWRRVVSGDYRARPATIRGFSRVRIRGEVYPALLRAQAESTVAGVLYLDLSPADLAALDRFESEGDAYLRIETPAELADGGEVTAWTYLYLHPARVEATPWDADRFARDDLPRFLDAYRRDRADP